MTMPLQSYSKFKYNHEESVRALFKHVLFRCGLENIVYLRRHLRGESTRHIDQESIAGAFSYIYETGRWGGREPQGSLSGSGSTAVATNDLRTQLETFLQEVNCQKFVDIGCGDYNWMRYVEGDFEYVGIDVVPSLIEAHNAAFRTEKRSFVCMDATQSALPSGDVALCRDVLFHLALRDGMQLLRNLKASGFRYVLLTSDKTVWFNSDSRNGDFRRINLMKPPFKLPEPLGELADDKVSKGRAIGVWPGSALPG